MSPQVRVPWSRAAGLATLWSFGGAVASAVIAGLIDMDNNHPDYGAYLSVTSATVAILTVAALCVSRSAIITGLVALSSAVIVVIFLAAFLLLDVLRMGA